MGVLDGLPRSDLGQEPFYSPLYDLNRIITGDLFTFTYMGDIVTLCGWEGSGKSFLCMNLVKAAQEQGIPAAVIDTEGPWRKEKILDSIGIDRDPDKLALLISSDIAQVVRFLQRLFDNIEKTNERVLLVIDSMTGMFLERDQKAWAKGEIKLDQGLEARISKKLMNAIKSYAKRYQFPVVVTSHLYKDPSGYGAADKLTGGGGIKFYSDTIVALKAVKDLGTDRQIRGVIVEAVTIKNRNIPPFQKGFFGIDFGTGKVDSYIGLVDMAVELGIFQVRGSWYEGPDGTKRQRRQVADLFTREVLDELNKHTMKFKRLHYQGSEFLELEDNIVDEGSEENEEEMAMEDTTEESHVDVATGESS